MVTKVVLRIKVMITKVVLRIKVMVTMAVLRIKVMVTKRLIKQRTIFISCFPCRSVWQLMYVKVLLFCCNRSCNKNYNRDISGGYATPASETRTQRFKGWEMREGNTDGAVNQTLNRTVHRGQVFRDNGLEITV